MGAKRLSKPQSRVETHLCRRGLINLNQEILDRHRLHHLSELFHTEDRGDAPLFRERLFPLGTHVGQDHDDK
jgi:hypothetical protein